MRRLIVNADDFGLTAGVNRAIAECHRDGVVSSATLMANGRAFDDAVRTAKSTPGLSMGCHVVLVDGSPVSPAGAVESLITSHGPQPGRFPSSLAAFAARAMLGGFDREELVTEIAAQIRKLQAAGLQVTHVDTHKHTHLFPEILAALLRAARICGVPCIRNPLVPLKALPVKLLKSNGNLWKRYGQVRVLHGLGRGFQRQARRAGLLAPDGVIGVVETGTADQTSVDASRPQKTNEKEQEASYGAILRQTLKNLPDGTWELVCHPGYDDADLRAAGTRLLDSRDDERRLLNSAAFRQFLLEQKMEVISYREFVASSAAA